MHLQKIKDENLLRKTFQKIRPVVRATDLIACKWVDLAGRSRTIKPSSRTVTAPLLFPAVFHCRNDVTFAWCTVFSCYNPIKVDRPEGLWIGIGCGLDIHHSYQIFVRDTLRQQCTRRVEFSVRYIGCWKENASYCFGYTIFFCKFLQDIKKYQKNSFILPVQERKLETS